LANVASLVMVKLEPSNRGATQGTENDYDPRRRFP
jgi:hypothetical protein